MRGAHAKNKRKRGRVNAARAAARKPSRSASPLNTAHQATMARDRRGHTKRRQSAGNSAAGSSIAAGMGLVHDRAMACIELPKRLVECRSPFELWREQARFIQEGFADYAHYAASVFPKLRNDSEVSDG